MRKTAIVGAGMIRFGKFPDRYIEDMGAEAALNALRHAGMGHKEIEAAFIGNVRNPPNAGQRILDEIGLSGIPTWNHENACGSSSAAFRDGYAAVASGIYDKVLVIGVEQMTRLGRGLLQFEDGSSLELDMGLVTPAMFSLIGMRHMEEFGTKPEQFAQISVKNHKQGAMNPYAQYQNELTLDEVLNSRMICDPITLLQCTPIGDGASAVVLTAGKIARRYTSKPVEVKASVFTGGRYKGEGRAVGIESCVRASREAYEASGIGPEDLDVIELHDCFTVHELVAYEDLGLCPKGEGGRLVDEGATALGGRIPVNTSGGLLSKGHPLGGNGCGADRGAGVAAERRMRQATGGGSQSCARTQRRRHRPGDRTGHDERHDPYAVRVFFNSRARSGGRCDGGAKALLEHGDGDQAEHP